MKYALFAILLASIYILSGCSNNKKVDNAPSIVNKDSIYAMNFYRDHTNVVPYEWKLISSIPPKDTSNVLVVVYKDEMSTFNEVYCMAVFENSKGTEYKLVAPWLNNMIIQKSNLLMEKTVIVPKSKMKEGK